MKKVSILVPVFSVERYFERCARSLFEQTYRDLEFVFVNDCTPDRSIDMLKEVIKEYPGRENSVKIVNHERNKGLAASRNTGLDHSTGTFIICVDSDDWLALDAVEQLMKRQMESDADMVSGDRLIHFEDKEELLSERKYENREQMILQMMQHTWDHFVTGRLFRRSLFVDNGLRWIEGYDVAEDRYMMTLLSYYSKVFDVVDRIIYHYERGNVNALTKTQDGQKIIRNKKQELGNLLSLEQFFRDKEPIYQKECSRCVMAQLEYYLQASVAYFSKDNFNHVADMIDDRCDADLKLIGWERSGIKGWLNHRFCYRVFLRYKKKAIRFIKRLFKTVFPD